MSEMEQRRRELQQELATVERKIVEEQREAWIAWQASERERRLIARFNAGDYIINSFGRCWWVNGGNLEELALPSEMDALNRLVSAGIVEHCSWSAIVKP